MLPKKMFFIFTLCITIFANASQRPQINPATTKQPKTPQTLITDAHIWLQEQYGEHTATNYLMEKSTIDHGSGITATSFTLFLIPEKPLIQLRIGAYYYFTFTQHASPESLRGTPLAPLLEYLKAELLVRQCAVRIPVTEKTFFDCEYSDSNIHCIRRGF